MELLKETSGLDRHSRWSDTKKKIDSDARYKAVDSSSRREDYFREFIKTLKSESKKDKRRSSTERKRSTSKNEDVTADDVKTANGKEGEEKVEEDAVSGSCHCRKFNIVQCSVMCVCLAGARRCERRRRGAEAAREGAAHRGVSAQARGGGAAGVVVVVARS